MIDNAFQAGRHATSVTPNRSALGLETSGALSQRYFGISANPESTAALCQAWDWVMVLQYR